MKQLWIGYIVNKILGPQISQAYKGEGIGDWEITGRIKP